jgi:hypothetical protein
VIGGLVGEPIHEIRESVLVARPRGPETGSIVVDGSPASLGALAIARAFAAHEDVDLVAVAAEGDKGIDPFVLDEIPGLERRSGHPVKARMTPSPRQTCL